MATKSIRAGAMLAYSSKDRFKIAWGKRRKEEYEQYTNRPCPDKSVFSALLSR
ncbi:hypothetical protein [Methylomonas albis]|jgi:hypothetical protein|uniref:Uncharacterized protein n=1 Tax=Methylomonas albis TaxID=1854563 RepID=A0ABR9CVF0_9GAMM|nr:hypothetical protein [Methylomonas albis]MBD9354366.1 hypothetical protein [Methylomonas albis]